jgi:hypothetical protein
MTDSTDFPVTNPFQLNYGGVRDAFVAKVNPVGIYLDYATYLGGSKYDVGNAIAVDSKGSAYVTGITESADFPIMISPVGFPPGLGVFMAFVTKLDPAGSTTAYSVFHGGGADTGLSIAVDPNGNAFVAGATNSVSFPVSSGAFQKTKPSGANLASGFVTKFNASGFWVHSTYLSGPDGDTFGNTIALDQYGNVFVGGDTSSTRFPGGPAIEPNGWIPCEAHSIFERHVLHCLPGSSDQRDRGVPTSVTPTDLHVSVHLYRRISLYRWSQRIEHRCLCRSAG